MPHPLLASQTLAAAYHALVQALPPDHLVLLANLLLALQHATLKDMNALVAETVHAPSSSSSKEVA